MMFALITNFIALLLIGLSGLEVNAQPKPLPASSQTADTQIDKIKIFNLVNKYREENNLDTLVWYEKLCPLADIRSEEIKSDWSHNGFYLREKSGELYGKYCPECSRMGENLIEHVIKSEEWSMESWKHSPKHNKNMLDNWDWACVGLYENNYSSMIFGKD